MYIIGIGEFYDNNKSISTVKNAANWHNWRPSCLKCRLKEEEEG